ncbi:GNAT family N-acetyltransferase [Vibrio sp. S4M6]|uniref:GNAT family N-acetyltransferase n=1 Tax=Vibrio sinus TaxID=2946865 RepID=UPI002029E736|nr:GNAT family N-acetyltransferase [Vibrio sinus]MCL9782796.1 GNAT family N-acetyltransferase [Vibrio sinus]
MQDLVNDLVELDRLNMSEIIAESGSAFCPTRRKGAIQREIESGSKFIYQYKNDELAGYIQYTNTVDNHIYVPSLQIHASHRSGRVLKCLLVDFALEVRKLNVQRLTSKVHINNKPSVKLHKRLGFVITEEVEQRYIFEMSGALLKKQMRLWSPLSKRLLKPLQPT